MHGLLRKFCILGASLTIVSCSQESEPEAVAAVDPLGPGEVAFVNGERVPESLFRLFTLTSMQVDVDNLTPEGRREMIERLVLLQLLADEAENNGLHEERRVAAELELARTQLLARAMTERFREDNPPTEAELRDLYEENLPRLRQTQYRARHILVDTEDEAVELISQLDQGADFAELASEHSNDSSGEDGGDLGWMSPDDVVEPFAVAMEATTVGEYLPTPVESQFGWHIVMVEEMRENVAPGLESVREDLMVGVTSQKLDNFATQLRENAEVTFPD